MKNPNGIAAKVDNENKDLQLSTMERYRSGVLLAVSTALYLYSMAELGSGSSLENGPGLELAIVITILAGALIGMTAKPVLFGKNYETQSLLKALCFGVGISFFSMLSAMGLGNDEKGMAALFGAIAVFGAGCAAYVAKQESKPKLGQ